MSLYRRPSSRPSAGVVAVAVAAIAVAVAVVAVAPAHALVARTVAIDGDFSDWQGVLRNPGNVVHDTLGLSDPDDPTQYDLVDFAVTWDAEYLYLYFLRTVRGAASNKGGFIAYIDVGRDGLLGTEDRVVVAGFGLSSFAVLMDYVPQGVMPDPIGGDGVTPAGKSQALLPSSVLGAMSASGHEYELRVDWTALRLPGIGPVQIHGALADDSLTSPSVFVGSAASVDDNADPIDTGCLHLDLKADRVRSLGSPGSVDFRHAVDTAGSHGQVVELSAFAEGGMRVELYTDPDANGLPDDLLGIDGNGDGDFGDAGDVLGPGADSNDNGFPDSGSLPAVGHFDFVVRVVVPGGLSATERTVLVAAHSAEDPTVQDRNLDRIEIGNLRIWPDQHKEGAAGSQVHFDHTVCNHGEATERVTLTAGSGNGWPTRVVDAIRLEPLADIELLPNQCFDGVRMVIDVPVEASPGTTDTLLLTASAAPTRTDSAISTLTIGPDLRLVPDHTAASIPGVSVFYPHRLVNAGTASASFAFDVTSTLATATSLWSDPNGDGDPSDGSPLLSIPTVEPDGGVFALVAQIDIPAPAVLGATDSTTILVIDESSQGRTASARDATFIRRVATYATPPPGMQVDRFPRCTSVFAAGGGLDIGGFYRFRWFDGDANLVRVSAPIVAVAPGRAVDSYPLASDVVLGLWEARLEQRVGASWLPVVPGGSHLFEVFADLTGTEAVISLVQASRYVFELTGDSVSITTVLDNDAPYPIGASTVIATVFQDADDNGQPSLGEWIIRGDGEAVEYVGPSSFTCRAGGLPDVLPGRTLLVTSCRDIGPITFPAAGEWKLVVQWNTGCGDRVASRVISWNVSCAGTAVASAGEDRFLCPGEVTELGAVDPEPSVRYLWSPTDSLDDPTRARPLASPTTTVTYTVLARGDDGCVAQDDVVVIPLTAPLVDAGPSATVCAGQSVRIGTVDGGGRRYGWRPSAGLDDPAAAQPLASPAVTTVYTLDVESLATGCVASDLVQVTVRQPPTADAGDDVIVPAPIGPGVCDPRFAYSWSPTVGLSDPNACRPVANPISTMSYCLTVRDSQSGCTSTPACITARLPCPPSAVERLLAVRSGADVTLSWTQVSTAFGGYHGDRVTRPVELATPPSPGNRVFATIADLTATTARDPGAMAASDDYYYRVVAVCADGITEGP